MKKLILLAFIFLGTEIKAQYNVHVNHVHSYAHFVAGFGVGTGASMLYGKTPRERIMIGTFSAAVAGIAKEGYDLYMGGKPSVTDIAFTTLGGFVSAKIVNWAMQKGKRKEKPCKM
jgi:VanZ family protein